MGGSRYLLTPSHPSSPLPSSGSGMTTPRIQLTHLVKKGGKGGVEGIVSKIGGERGGEGFLVGDIGGIGWVGGWGGGGVGWGLGGGGKQGLLPAGVCPGGHRRCRIETVKNSEARLTYASLILYPKPPFPHPHR